MEERPFHPLDYVSVVRRRFLWFAIPLAICVIGGAILAMVLPSWYRAEAMIGVTSATVSPDVTKSGAASLDREERVRAVTQQLFSRPLLERVAREEDLTHGRPMEPVVAELRRRTAVRVNDPFVKAAARPGLDTFAISYTDRTPEQTQRVTNRLAQVFVDEMRRSRESRAERSSEFLATQLRDSQDRLTQLEERLRQKKEAYMGRLPEQRDANLQMVATLSQRLEASSNSLRGEQDRLTMVERQIEAMRQGTDDVAPIRAGLGPSTAQGRVALLQRQLADARMMYTDKHPEIQRLQQELADARTELTNVGNGGERDDLLRSDPTYQQLLADRNLARLRVQSLRRDEGAMRAQIAEYQRRVEAAPMVEQELAALTREYGLEKAQYGQLSEKHKTALVSEDLERKQGNERFSLLYPAARPDSPESPNRARLMLMALALGLALGAGLVFGREYLDRSIHDSRALQAAFDVPVLAEIPHLGSTVQGS
jgi:polysaccharide chain length determinant protein (PEP-CTERM system associated)